jgi:hypothetical protein
VLSGVGKVSICPPPTSSISVSYVFYYLGEVLVLGSCFSWYDHRILSYILSLFVRPSNKWSGIVLHSLQSSSRPPKVARSFNSFFSFSFLVFLFGPPAYKFNLTVEFILVKFIEGLFRIVEFIKFRFNVVDDSLSN